MPGRTTMTAKQLARLRTPRPRAKRQPKPPPITPPESAVLKDVLAYLDLIDAFVFRANAGAVPAGGRLVRMAPAGTADVVGVLGPAGRFIAVETKRKGGRLTAAQCRFRDKVEARGGLYVVACCTQDVYEALVAAGYRGVRPPPPHLI